MAKRARKQDPVPTDSSPDSPETAGTRTPPPAETPARVEGTSADPNDTSSLRKAALFFGLAVAALVVLKLLLGW